MADGNIFTGPKDSRPNPALPRWMWRSYRWLSLFTLGVALVMLFALGRAGIAMFPFFLVGTVFLGFDATGGPLRNQTAVFLLSRPVSRRQVYNLLLLGALGPWLILTVVPDLWDAVVPLGHFDLWPSRFAGVPEAFYLLFALWVLAFYLFNAYLGCSGSSLKSKSVQLPQFIMLLLVLALDSATVKIWGRPAWPWR